MAPGHVTDRKTLEDDSIPLTLASPNVSSSPASKDMINSKDKVKKNYSASDFVSVNVTKSYGKGFTPCVAYPRDLITNKSDDTEVKSPKLHFECLDNLVLSNEFCEKVIFYILGKEKKTQLGVIDLLLLSLPVARNPNLCSSEILIMFFNNTEPRSQLKKYCKIDQRKDQLHSDAASDQIPAPLLYLYLYLYLYIFVSIFCLLLYIYVLL